MSAPLGVVGLREGNWHHPDGGRIVGWVIEREDADRMGADCMCLPGEVAEALANLRDGYRVDVDDATMLRAASAYSKPGLSHADALRAAIAAALAQQPAGRPERIVLWSRGVSPNWYFVARKSRRPDIDGAPVYETLDEIVLREAQQPGALDGVMHKVAAIAHSGGLIGMDPHEALTAIRRLSLPYWRKEEKPEQVDAALAAQPGGTHG